MQQYNSKIVKLPGTSKPNLTATKLQHENLNNDYKKTTNVYKQN